MKRRILIAGLLALLLMLISTSALAACGFTWTEDGVTYSCTNDPCNIKYYWNFIPNGNGEFCLGGYHHVDRVTGDGYTEYDQLTFKSTQHDWSRNITTPATCTKRAQWSFLCGRCGWAGNLWASDSVDPNNHPADKLTRVEVPATCCEAGSYKMVCSDCGGTASADAIPPLGHTAAGATYDVLVEPTCSKEGSYGVYCSKTNKELSYRVLPKDDSKHTFPSTPNKSASPTCQHGYLNTFICTSCGYVMETDMGGKKDHEAAGKATVIVDATCAKEGSQVYYCMYGCGKEMKKEAIPVKDHTVTDASRVSPGEASTCYYSGYNNIHCVVCDQVAKRAPLPLTDHTFDEWQVQVPATCTSEGVKTRICVCQTWEEETIPVRAHDWTVWGQVKAPTYTEEGLESRNCQYSDCDAEQTRSIPKLTATPDPTKNPGGAPTPKPTKNPNDNPISKPTKNPYPIPTPVIDPNHKHSESELKGYDPTCTEWGREDGTICDICGDAVNGGEWIPPTGHTPVVIPAVPATPTEKGLSEGLKCGNCGEILKEQFPVDYEGNYYDPDDPDGPSIGTEIPHQPGDIVDPSGENVIGRLEDDVITDPTGGYIGSVDDEGNIIDENGNVIGKVDENGKVTDKDGRPVGDVVGYDELIGRLEPGHPNFDLNDYLDEYYTHVENGDQIRPTIDDDKCIIGTKVTLTGTGTSMLIKGAEDYAICPADKYPMSQWIDLGNGTHMRICTCLDCDYYEVGTCVFFHITVDEVEYKVCPICGHFTERAYEWIKGVKVGGVGNMNSLIARDIEAPFGTAPVQVKDMSAEKLVVTTSFTAVKSTKGALDPWNGSETLYIPMVHPGDVALVQLNMDGEFKTVPFMYDNGFVIFNADQHGLYLFVD